MVRYTINHWRKSCRYDTATDTIYIGSNNLSNLSDNEIIEYISDSLIHEHIHRVLYKMFNLTATKLFDAIEYNFRNQKLHKKGLSNVGEFVYKEQETYHTFIKRMGFKAFLEYYHISNNDFNQSYIICNRRLK